MVSATLIYIFVMDEFLTEFLIESNLPYPWHRQLFVLIDSWVIHRQSLHHVFETNRIYITYGVTYGIVTYLWKKTRNFSQCFI